MSGLVLLAALAWLSATPELRAQSEFLQRTGVQNQAVELTDGERIYRTLPVKVTQARAGSAGFWTESLAYVKPEH